jgi:hypothetical protein
MKLKTILLPALLCAALSPAFAGQTNNFLVSAGVGHTNINGQALNQARVGFAGLSGPVLFAGSLADGNHNGVSARQIDASAGYSLNLHTPGLVVAPMVDVGYAKLGESSSKHVALGVAASYTFKNDLMLSGNLYTGRAFGTSGIYDSGSYNAAGVGLGYPVGPGAVLLAYDWNRSPAAGGQHILERGPSLSYAMTF